MNLFVITVAILALVIGEWAHAQGLQQAAVDRFINEMAGQHGFDRTALRALFDRVNLSPEVLSAISRPVESKPWYKYRPIFVTSARTHAGSTFWRHNSRLLEQAERRYGVPSQVILAILGVETFYGRHMGNHRVADALATLAFHYPPRARFFRGELEQLLLLSREQQLDPLSLRGSYAGAMGLPQFISSSYRHYGVDFDGDGVIDLWNNTGDAIASVANYLKSHGWEVEQPVAVRAHITSRAYARFLDKRLEPSVDIRTLKQAGIIPESGIDGNPLAVLIPLETETGYEYWLGLKNFYVITRYNRSPLYAMAVYQLSEAILESYEGHAASHVRKSAKP